MGDLHDALTAATERAQAQQELRAARPLTFASGWWTPFLTKGRSGQVAVQRSDGHGVCPAPAIYPCDCGYPRSKELTP